MLNVSTVMGTRESASDALRYGQRRHGEATPRSSTDRRPVVVWNCTRACNLTCEHCYASARRAPFDDELRGDEARAFLTDLADFGVPAVLVSGGEPLVRPDLLDLIAFGRERGLRFTLSSNGTLIDAPTAGRIADVGVTYVGVSIDGTEPGHDRLRRSEGSWRRSVEGLRHLGAAGVRRGVRFTLTPETIDGLPAVLDLVVDEGIERICLYHLVPAGRGGALTDVTPAERRAGLHTLFEFAAAHPDTEVLTVDNPSDAVELVAWLRAHRPERAETARELLTWNRGATAGSGIGIGCVSERGDVHPDQFSRHRILGNLRDRPFSEIWRAPDAPFVQLLRSGTRPTADRCGACPELDICGGGFRARAEGVTGDPWGFDPSCALVGAG